MNDLPPPIVSSSCRKFIGCNLDKTLTVRIGYPMTWRKDFKIVDRLYMMIVFVIVDLAEYLVLDNLMFVWFYDFVCDS